MGYPGSLPLEPLEPLEPPDELVDELEELEELAPPPELVPSVAIFPPQAVRTRSSAAARTPSDRVCIATGMAAPHDVRRAIG
jgi:hypothetical protein